MTSTVTQFSNQINVNFPVAGQDNDSQGFRNNFSKIQNAFATAAQEITTLQTNSVSLNETNDFGNNVLRRAALQSSSQVVNDGGVANATSGTEVNYLLGSYQTFSVDTSTSYTFNVTNWPPAGFLGTVRIELTPTDTGPVTVGFGGAEYLGDVTGPVTHTNDDVPIKPIVWELFSPDNGAKILAWQLR